MCALAGLAVRAGAVPPLPGGHRPGDRSTCRVNGEALGRRVASLRAQARGAAPLAPPSPLNPTVYVLRVDFSGTAMSASLATTRNFFQQVQDYYVENSYGVFVPTFTVSPVVYTLGHTLAYYGANSGALCSGINDVTCGVGELFADATTAAAAVDFSPYDHLMIYHAGSGEESNTSLPNNLWSLYMPDSNTLDGKTFQGFTLVPESESGLADPLGVICHEYGHQLGLPDLYDTSTGLATIGTWDLMDYPWAGSPQGSNPPHLGAWCKKFLGFGTVQPASTGTVTFLPVETNNTGVHELYATGQEYFLAEYRSKTAGAYDAALPQAAGGLALWHVDDAVALNGTVLSNNNVNAASSNGFGHRGVDLVEADGVEANPDGGDLGNNNAWDNGQTATSPQTDLFGGQASSLAISNITGVGGGSVQATITFFLAASEVSVGKVRGYPNPSGGRYPARAGAPTGTLATLRFELTRPVAARDLRMDIYALDGGRVRSIGGTGMRFRDDVSENFNWVYEFDWDGKNESGDEVGSGVYLIHLDADGHTVNGKLAIER